ncbi:arylamine N-acetyltransferase family protein [Bacillus sp. 1P06AnD]|uniref:arylamine N-acetyltransferase family protein n=1 Tax=Bacillus sp. 1P06AnD TaxID=3132208 RepID=UPI00399F5EEE
MASNIHLFWERIGLPEKKEIGLNDLPGILTKMAYTIPFENLSVMDHQIDTITKENLVKKILVRKRGGLCYELNPLLFYALKDYISDVQLISGTVCNPATQEWSPTGETHVAILLAAGNKRYIVDNGFGINLPLAPVPLDGEIISTGNGDFKIRKVKHSLYELLVKRNSKDPEWKIGYSFHTGHEVGLDELNAMQKTIVRHPQSPFNKSPLISMLKSDGSIIMSGHSITYRSNGEVNKLEFPSSRFKMMAKEHFNLLL